MHSLLWYKSEMDISASIKRIARGKHGSEHLNQTEARTAFHALLQPDADALQLGAFLIGQRMKGETSAELAGFVEAARLQIPDYGRFDTPDHAVDLPCYAGKRRAAHAYLAAALRMRDTGIAVCIHGIEQIDGRISALQILQAAGIKAASTLADAHSILAEDRIVYADLRDLCPDLFRIYALRNRIGVRSFANTVARLLNPMRCDGQLNGFFHTPYADYMAQANQRLGQPRSLIFMGAEGEPELYADRQKIMLKQQGECLHRVSFPAAGLPPYPRQAKDLMLLKQHSCAMLDGSDSDTCGNERERIVIDRMCEAFTWAAGGDFPATWTMEDKA